MYVDNLALTAFWVVQPCSTMSLSSYPFLWFSCVLSAIAYGSSSDNNPTYASYTVNFQKKCSYRSHWGRRKYD